MKQWIKKILTVALFLPALTYGQLVTDRNVATAVDDTDVVYLVNAAGNADWQLPFSLLREETYNSVNPGQLLLDPAQDFGTTTGLAFGDGDTVIYETADDALCSDMGGVVGMCQTETAGEIVVTFAPYMRHVFIPSSSAITGPSAPSRVTIGTSRGIQFATDPEEVFLTINIPSDWDGASDLDFEIHWSAEEGDALTNSETVIWDITYHSVASEGEAVDNGTVASGTATHTQSGAGIDKELYDIEITLPYTGGNQPLTAGDHLFIQFDRDVTGDTYSGDPVVMEWHVMYTSVRIPQG